MGRLTLNILLSFAQFEREIITERVRDKIAAAKKRGKRCGGVPVLGYDLADGKLVVNPKEAKLVRHIMECFLKIGSTTILARQLNEQGHYDEDLDHPQGEGAQRPPLEQAAPIPLAQQPRLPGGGHPQGERLSRRALGHHPPRLVGQGPRHPGEEPLYPRQSYQGQNAGAPEGPDPVRPLPDEHGDHVHPQGRAHVPLLPVRQRLEGRLRGLPGQERGRRRNRSGW